MNYDEINEFLKKNTGSSSQSKDNRNSDNKASSENCCNDDGNNHDSTNENNYGFFYTAKNGYGCNDMPGGFQKINPTLFIVIGDILGDVMAGKLPFNVQNAIGNWIQLVGQSIETYSSQQQYFQSGPGRYYSPENLNVTNSFCPSASSEASASSSAYSEQTNSCCDNNMKDMENIMKGLYTLVKELISELDDVKKKIDFIEKNSHENNSNITE